MSVDPLHSFWAQKFKRTKPEEKKNASTSWWNERDDGTLSIVDILNDAHATPKTVSGAARAVRVDRLPGAVLNPSYAIAQCYMAAIKFKDFMGRECARRIDDAYTHIHPGRRRIQSHTRDGKY